MKRYFARTALVLAIAALLPACGMLGSRDSGIAAPVEARGALKDRTIAADFRDEGVKVFYNMFGSVDRVEVVGIAPAWRGNVTIIAEADAMDKLVKFVHQRGVKSDQRTQLIAHTLDRARDNTLNSIRGADGTETVDMRQAQEEFERATANGTLKPQAYQDPNNSSRRVAERVERGLVEATTTITAQGRLTGVRKIRDGVIMDGKYYMAVYQWSPRDQATAESIRRQMR